ncbi:ribonuclease domain-containing protein, partial [Maribacter sp. 2-571]|uniref:ribonuclease domain-containing protein n=1 Tax=Maribacter sp. 2-571 TaxID=3417569 RepID=UPI003D32E056
NSNGSVLPSSKLPATTVARWVSEATAFLVRKFKSESALGEIFGWFGLDEVEVVLTEAPKGNVKLLALQIGTGKLKKLKKLARWAKKNKGKKIPGTKKGGVPWENDGRDGGQVLPRKDANGKAITYTEYDINKSPQHGASRGKERMVIGSDGKTYYTRDHYKTFKEFKD